MFLGVQETEQEGGNFCVQEIKEEWGIIFLLRVVLVLVVFVGVLVCLCVCVCVCVCFVFVSEKCDSSSYSNR